jgi:hypothetical protein
MVPECDDVDLQQIFLVHSPIPLQQTHMGSIPLMFSDVSHNYMLPERGIAYLLILDCGNLYSNLCSLSKNDIQ